MKLAILLLSAIAALAQESPACDRACLEGFANQYLDALVAHNPFGLPLARKVKLSENDVVLDPGDGLWNTITGGGTYKLIVSDPHAGEVGVIATMRENSTPIAVAARLKIENRKISELETLVQRMGAAQLIEQAFTQTGEQTKPEAALAGNVPAAQRISRDALIAAANKYFDAIEKGSADPAAFDPHCRRVENGAQAANPWAQDCAGQIDTKILSSTQRIYPRRFAVVDEDRQLVFGFFTCQQPGDRLSVESPGHGVYKFPDSATQPAFLESALLFQIDSGKVGWIDSLTVALPYGMPDPFFKDDWRKP